MSWLWTGLRWLWGGFFVALSLAMFAVLLTDGTNPIRQPNPAAQAWTDGIESAPFFIPLLATTYLAGGVCMLIPRTVPLGLAMLTAPMLVIVAYHFTLSRDVVWGAISGGIHALLLWRYREGFAPLWQWREDNRAAT